MVFMGDIDSMDSIDSTDCKSTLNYSTFNALCVCLLVRQEDILWQPTNRQVSSFHGITLGLLLFALHVQMQNYAIGSRALLVPMD